MQIPCVNLKLYYLDSDVPKSKNRILIGSAETCNLVIKVIERWKTNWWIQTDKLILYEQPSFDFITTIQRQKKIQLEFVNKFKLYKCETFITNMMQEKEQLKFYNITMGGIDNIEYEVLASSECQQPNPLFTTMDQLGFFSPK